MSEKHTTRWTAGSSGVTFDENILYRTCDLSLGSEAFGTSLLDDDQTLMELKITGALPLWMSHALCRLDIYQSSFSKYGQAYQRMMARSAMTTQRRNFHAC